MQDIIPHVFDIVILRAIEKLDTCRVKIDISFGPRVSVRKAVTWCFPVNIEVQGIVKLHPYPSGR
jgi:hypothetical protein